MPMPGPVDAVNGIIEHCGAMKCRHERGVGKPLSKHCGKKTVFESDGKTVASSSGERSSGAFITRPGNSVSSIRKSLPMRISQRSRETAVLPLSFSIRIRRKAIP